MALETEAKIKVDAHEPLIARLRELHATREGRVIETNRLFDDEAQSLRRADRGLRIRVCRDDAGNVVRSTLTLKGPQQAGPLKCREEMETEVADAESAARILSGLGYRQVLCFEKRRETWRLDACHVELDELPRLGLFVEIEGPPEALEGVRARLGLADLPLIRQTYVAMVAGILGASPQPENTLRF